MVRFIMTQHTDGILGRIARTCGGCRTTLRFCPTFPSFRFFLNNKIIGPPPKTCAHTLWAFVNCAAPGNGFCGGVLNILTSRVEEALLDLGMTGEKSPLQHVRKTSYERTPRPSGNLHSTRGEHNSNLPNLPVKGMI
jgi:hypothetical protein